MVTLKCKKCKKIWKFGKIDKKGNYYINPISAYDSLRIPKNLFTKSGDPKDNICLKCGGELELTKETK